jgi:hypothetical protein
MDNLQTLPVKKYPKLYVPYELLVNLAVTTDVLWCSVIYDLLLRLYDVAFAVGTSDSGSLYLIKNCFKRHTINWKLKRSTIVTFISESIVYVHLHSGMTKQYWTFLLTNCGCKFEGKLWVHRQTTTFQFTKSKYVTVVIYHV